jgi:hypothetical protein
LQTLQKGCVCYICFDVSHLYVFDRVLDFWFSFSLRSSVLSCVL